MSENFLDAINLKTRERVGRIRTVDYVNLLRRRAEKVREGVAAHRFRESVTETERTNIIAEIKRAMWISATFVERKAS